MADPSPSISRPGSARVVKSSACTVPSGAAKMLGRSPLSSFRCRFFSVEHPAFEVERHWRNLIQACRGDFPTIAVSLDRRWDQPERKFDSFPRHFPLCLSSKVGSDDFVFDDDEHGGQDAVIIKRACGCVVIDVWSNASAHGGWSNGTAFIFEEERPCITAAPEHEEGVRVD